MKQKTKSRRKNLPTWTQSFADILREATEAVLGTYLWVLGKRTLDKTLRIKNTFNVTYSKCLFLVLCHIYIQPEEKLKLL